MRHSTGPAIRRIVLALSAVAAWSTGCRDGVAPFTTEPPDDLGGDTYRLTFNPARDFNPAWSRGSDTVYYSTAHFIDQPIFNGTLIRIAAFTSSGISF